MAKSQLYYLKSYMGTGLISISSMTLIILGPTKRLNKDTLGVIDVLTNAMTKKPHCH